MDKKKFKKLCKELFESYCRTLVLIMGIGNICLFGFMSVVLYEIGLNRLIIGILILLMLNVSLCYEVFLKGVGNNG